MILMIIRHLMIKLFQIIKNYTAQCWINFDVNKKRFSLEFSPTQTGIHNGTVLQQRQPDTTLNSFRREISLRHTNLSSNFSQLFFYFFCWIISCFQITCIWAEMWKCVVGITLRRWRFEMEPKIASNFSWSTITFVMFRLLEKLNNLTPF